MGEETSYECMIGYEGNGVRILKLLVKFEFICRHTDL